MQHSITNPDPSTKTRPQFDGSELGPIMTKKLKRALYELAQWETQRIERHDYGDMLVGNPFGPITNQTARDLAESIHADFDGIATKKNYKHLIQAAQEALPAARAGAQVEDHRTTPEEQERRKAARDARVDDRNKEKEANAAAWAPIMTKKPANARAMIIAELDHDESDLMTDYHGHTTTRRVLIGWRTGGREDFKQLRRAAGQFEPTKHLGMGCDDWEAHAYQAPDEGRTVYRRSERLGERFLTEADAREHVEAGIAKRKADSARSSYPRVCDWWDSAIDYGYELGMSKVEHRENYSMGGGNYLKRGSRDSSGWKVSSHPIPTDGSAPWQSDIEDGLPVAPVGSPVVPAPGLREGFSIQEATNKKGPFFLVVNAERVEREEFLELRDSAKAAGGWYSRAWGGTPGGFGFNTRPEAEAWAGGSGSAPQGPGGGKEPERLEGLADKMQDEINHKRAPLTQNPTRRRFGIKEGQRRDADRLERVQEGLRAVASAMRAGTLPEALRGFISRAAVDRGLGHSALAALVGNAGTEARALIHAEQAEQTKIDELRFQKIPGFFPTPPAVIQRMLEAAELDPGMDVLEPSAGIGSILEAVKDHREGLHLTWVEQNPTLYKITRDKDIAPTLRGHCDDFLAMADLYRGEFDRVLMNPPFEKGQAVTHTLAAARCLKPDGKVVAVVPPTAVDKIKEALPVGFDNHTLTLPDGSFKGVQAFRQTGVSVVLIVIDREEN